MHSMREEVHSMKNAVILKFLQWCDENDKGVDVCNVQEYDRFPIGEEKLKELIREFNDSDPDDEDEEEDEDE